MGRPRAWVPTDDEWSRVLLLVARGATAEDIAALVGVTSRTVERRLPELGQAYRDALAARAVVARTHGKPNTYNQGCRCIPCKESRAEAARLRRERCNPPTHGTVSAYKNHGCRCDECKAAGRRENAELWRKIRAGEIALSHRATCKCPPCVVVDAQRRAEKKAQNDASQDDAHHSREQWTGPELETALQRNAEGGWLRTAPEVAPLIGRSIEAVRRKRQAECDPRVGRIAGVSA